MRGPSASRYLGDVPRLEHPFMVLLAPLFYKMARLEQAEPLKHPAFRRLVRLGDTCLLPMTMGAPMAAQQAEHLAACGATRILQAGIAGSLDASLPAGSLVRSRRFLNQTGTALFYGQPWDDYLDITIREDSKPLSQLIPVSADVWTTDGVYRETDDLITRRCTQGVGLVEMEGAALAAVCADKGMPFDAVYCVSDELFRDEWRQSIGFRTVDKGLDEMAAILTTLAWEPQ